MHKKGSGKNRVEAVLMDIIASSEKLTSKVDEMLVSSIKDSQQDLRDDVGYAVVHKRVELMHSLPDNLLRGHVPLLDKELSAAIQDDLSRTSGDEIRHELQQLRDMIKCHVCEAQVLMTQIDKPAED